MKTYKAVEIELHALPGHYKLTGAVNIKHPKELRLPTLWDVEWASVIITI
jgi:hypothetical protein